MRNKLFVILLAFAAGGFAIWFGDGVVSFSKMIATFVSIVAIVGMGIYGYIYLDQIAKEGPKTEWFAAATFVCSAVFFGALAAPITAQDWGSPWLLMLFVGCAPLFIELRELGREFTISQLPPRNDAKVVPFHHEP